MTTVTNVEQVKLNVMTQEQYDSATKNPTELYMITDAKVDYNDLDNKPVVDQTFSAVSTNAQSGIAVKSAIDSAVSSVYKPAGTKTFAQLPTPVSSILGNVYNISNDFTTDNRFVEGAGKEYPAGTNVVVIEQEVVVQTDYYGWEHGDGGHRLYTTSATPESGDTVYQSITPYEISEFTVIGTATGYDSSTNKLLMTWGSGSTVTQQLRRPDYDKSTTATAYFYDVLPGFIDLSGYQPLLVSGTNIKTINGSSVLGSGDITISSGDSLPDQTGHSGEFLTTDGSSPSWAAFSGLENTATGVASLTVLGTSTAAIDSINIGTSSTANSDLGSVGGGIVAIGNVARGKDFSTVIGSVASSYSNCGVAIGWDATITANNPYGIAIGTQSTVSAYGAIQLGANSTNNEAGTFKVALASSGTTFTNYKLLNSAGKIPDDRLNTPIPAQTGQSGKVLSTNGSTVSWTDVPVTQIIVRDWSEEESE